METAGNIYDDNGYLNKVYYGDEDGGLYTYTNGVPKQISVGGGGSSNYNLLSNKPQINGVTLQGNNTDIAMKNETATKQEFQAVSSTIAELEDDKQDILVSGINIKTINNESILGQGNINIQGGGTSDFNLLENIPTKSLSTLSQNDIEDNTVITLNKDITIDSPLYIDTKSNVTIDGNNKNITLTSGKLFVIANSNNITIKNINIITQGNDKTTSWAFVIHNYVSNVTFDSINIKGDGNGKHVSSGILCNSPNNGGNYYNYNYRFINCSFYGLRTALAWLGRSEFGIINGCRFYSCKVGCWSEAGNWSIIGSKLTACAVPYTCCMYTNECLMCSYEFPKGTTVWGIRGNNIEHGTIVGCEFNHANSGGSDRSPVITNDYYMNTSSHQVTSSYPTAENNNVNGVQFRSCITPTITGCTFYYCNLIGNSTLETKQVITGSTFDNACNIKQNVSGKWYVLGCGKNGGGPNFTNVTDCDNVLINDVSAIPQINTKIANVQEQLAALKTFVEKQHGDIPKPEKEWFTPNVSLLRRYGNDETNINYNDSTLQLNINKSGNSPCDGYLFPETAKKVRWTQDSTQNHCYYFIVGTTQKYDENVSPSTKAIMINFQSSYITNYFNLSTGQNTSAGQTHGVARNTMQQTSNANGWSFEAERLPTGEIHITAGVDGNYTGSWDITLNEPTGLVNNYFGLAGYNTNSASFAPVTISNIKIYDEVI